MHQYRYLSEYGILFLYFFRNVNSKLLFRASPNPFSDKEIFIIFDSFRVKFQISLNTRENITWSNISHVKMIIIWQIFGFSKFNRARLWPTGSITWSNWFKSKLSVGWKAFFFQILAEISAEFKLKIKISSYLD